MLAGPMNPGRNGSTTMHGPAPGPGTTDPSETVVQFAQSVVPELIEQIKDIGISQPPNHNTVLFTLINTKAAQFVHEDNGETCNASVAFAAISAELTQALQRGVYRNKIDTAKSEDLVRNIETLNTEYLTIASETFNRMTGGDQNINAGELPPGPLRTKQTLHIINRLISIIHPALSFPATTTTDGDS